VAIKTLARWLIFRTLISFADPVAKVNRSKVQVLCMANKLSLCHICKEPERRHIKTTLDALKAQKRKALIPYVMAGFPNAGITPALMRGMVESGATSSNSAFI
jgi:hypothetical protein